DALSQFNEKTGKQYDKIQLKNKWDNLKKKWSAWYKFFGKETGLEWDILNIPLMHQMNDELTILFKDVMADGKFAWAPSSGMLPSGIEEDGDGYQPYFEEGHIDIEEGSGDSEEDIGASVG
ncbi:hypothetical protein HN873_016182, partial [Arachis hypogaea]